jgi:uncharacterized protein (DUF4213/DUF364 family)
VSTTNVVEALLSSLSTDASVRQVVVGAFWTAVALETEPVRCGLASTLRPAAHPNRPPIGETGSMLDLSGRELACWLHSDSTLEASTGMAAFNALLEVDPAACTEVNAADIIEERGAGRRVAIVGHFPFIERIRRVAAHCDVLELDPRPGDLPAGRAVEVLPQADVVALTGTSIINHTFDDLAQLCAPDAFVVVLGGSAPLTPVLFGFGVDAVAGTLVVDWERAVATISQGATFRQIGGKRLLVMTRDSVLR